MEVCWVNILLFLCIWFIFNYLVKVDCMNVKVGYGLVVVVYLMVVDKMKFNIWY